MSYLKFDKNLMINLEQSLPKEMLRTNKSGAYHCTTIVGCNTRKQHGLLVIPIPEMDDKAHVLLSSLDESVIQHGAPFNLGLHQYGDNVFSPNGHKYIREFNCETVPTMIYRVGGVVLSKEKVFISHENRILIKYTLLDAHSETKLRFRPFLAFRNANDLCVENGAIKTVNEPVENGIATCLYEGYPNLYMQFNKPVAWVNDGHWYKGKTFGFRVISNCLLRREKQSYSRHLLLNVIRFNSRKHMKRSLRVVLAVQVSITVSRIRQSSFILRTRGAHI